MINLEPILIDIDTTKQIYANENCKEIFMSYPSYYYKVGYHPPWIGYFVMQDNKVVGVAGFISKPVNGRVEIAYGTFPEYQRQGIASFACQTLINIAKSEDADVVITAKTAPEINASVTILKRHGFIYTGIVQDEEIGDAWEWVLPK